MPAVRAARSACVGGERLAHPQVELVFVQPSLHDRGLEHADYLLAVGV